MAGWSGLRVLAAAFRRAAAAGTRLRAALRLRPLVPPVGRGWARRLVFWLGADILEMTDNQGVTVALMATSFVAFGVSRLVCPQALYGVLAHRLLHAIEPEETARNAPQTAPAIVSD